MFEHHFNLSLIFALHLIIQFFDEFKLKLHSLVYSPLHIRVLYVFVHPKYGQYGSGYGILSH